MNNSTGQERNDSDNLVDLLDSNPHFKNFLYFLIALNSLSFMLAAVLNSLIILTFIKTPSLRTPSYILILSLAFFDFGVGVVMQPVYCCRLAAWASKNLSMHEESKKVFLRSYYMLMPGSLLMITAITFDRFLAVHLRLRYQQLVTTKRSYALVIVIWIISLASSFLTAIHETWFVFAKDALTVMIVLLNISLMLIISRAIHKHSLQIQDHQHPQQPTMNVQRYKKSVKTMYYITCVFLVCYLPGYIFYVVNYVLAKAGHHIGIESHYAGHLANTLMMLNSALNPLIYCWRIEEIRNALLLLLRKQSQ